MQSWSNFGKGFIAGLSITPPKNENSCKQCTSFGYNLGLAQTALYNIEYSRSSWVDSGKVTKLNFLELLSTLIIVYPQLKSFSKSILNVLMDDNLQYTVN